LLSSSDGREAPPIIADAHRTFPARGENNPPDTEESQIRAPAKSYTRGGMQITGPLTEHAGT
jgi:hypothetical protein